MENDEGVVERRFSWVGVLPYSVLLPLLHVSTNSPKAAIQSVLHALLLPTPAKVLSQSISPQRNSPTEPKPKSTNASKSLICESEVLRPGALYAECAVIRLDLSILTSAQGETGKTKLVKDDKGKGKAEAKGFNLEEEVLQIEDNGEYGGEIAGRMVQEAYEAALKVWEWSVGDKKGCDKS